MLKVSENANLCILGDHCIQVIVVRSHGRKRQKTFEKYEKVPFSSCTWEAYEGKWRKKFVGQWLGVTLKSWLTPKSWLLIWNFSLVQSQRATNVVITECEWGKTEHARLSSVFYNVWLDQTEWSRNSMIQNVFWKTMLRKCNIPNRPGVLVWVLHSIQ